MSGVELIVIKKPRSFSDYKGLAKVFSGLKFDLFLCTQANLRVNALYPFIKAKRKIGFDSKRGRDGHSLFISERIPFKKEHSLEAFLGFADYLGIEDDSIDYQLSVNEEHLQSARVKVNSDNYLVIHPVASSLERTLKVAQYVEIIERLSARMPEVKVVLTGVSADQEFVAKVISEAKHENCLSLCGQTSVKELAAVLREAKVVIAPDSGPIHLANAVGAKVVGLYAAVPPEYTGPYGQEQNCVNKYPQALEKFLGKNVSQVSWRTRVKGEGLMDLITCDDIMEKIDQLNLC
jgi:heptosyltransferase I